MTRIEIHRHTVDRPWTYADLERRQEEVRHAVLRGEAGRLVFSEVAPVITLGFRKMREDLLLSKEEYDRRGIVLLEVSRGGRATYHGPGQWIVFPIESLEKLTGDRRGVRKTVETLLGAVKAATGSRFPLSEIREGKEAGVWTQSGPKGAKFAALGVRILDGVLQHGISINIFPTLESFAGIRPCGLDSPVAFLEEDETPITRERLYLEWRLKLESELLKRFPTFA